MAIFVILGLVVWLRALSYAYWAAGITAALALLYSYFGQSSSALLMQRLEEIILGALLAILSACLIFPIKTADALRLRRYQAIIALNEFLTATRTDPRQLSRHHHRVQHALDEVDEIADPLLAQRRLRRRWHPGPHPADTLDILTRCRPIVDAISKLTDDREQLNPAGDIQAATDAPGQEITRLRRHARRETRPSPSNSNKERAMPSTPQSTIQAGAQLVTLINVFTVDPADQEHLIDRWRQATEDVLCHRPGFISANLHRGLDGTKVVNYAQWESQEAFQAMLRDPTAGPLLRELAEIATPAPVLCEVVSVHHA